MSTIDKKIEQAFSFYLSSPQPCPYLPERTERKLFTRLTGASDAELNAALCRAGFRRSHDIVYRPACGECTACTPVRIPAQFFTPTRSLKRVAARNRDLSWQRTETKPTPELFRLFSAYQDARHKDGDMAHMDENDFAAMLHEGRDCVSLFLLRDATSIKGCMIADKAGDGLSAVYSFFDPAEPRRSLGSELILRLIRETREQGLSFVYMGFFIAAAQKMAYKSRFKPLQILTPTGWTESP